MKIIYLMGKSSSGKDTIFNILRERLDVNLYVMYTTRPKRKGEIEGETYNYISDEKMKSYIEGKEENKLVEFRTYQTVYGPWTYATIADEQFNSEKDILTLGTLESYMKMKEYFKEQIVPIYIEVDDGIRLQRALSREMEQNEPKYAELCRRFLEDSKDFSDKNIKEAGIEKRFQNIDLEKCVKEIIEFIKKI